MIDIKGKLTAAIAEKFAVKVRNTINRYVDDGKEERLYAGEFAEHIDGVTVRVKGANAREWDNIHRYFLDFKGA